MTDFTNVGVPRRRALIRHGLRIQNSNIYFKASFPLRVASTDIQEQLIDTI
jgi:hypothetical protein